MGTYTENMIDEFWGDKYDLHEDMDYQEILEFLNEEFLSFSKRLEYFIRAILPQDDRTILEIIRSSCKQNGINIAEFGSINTLKDWIAGKRTPDQDDKKAREKLFLIAFILGLNVEQTQRLFTKVYLDRPIYVRNYRELIYYHCLENNYSYAMAKELIEKVNFVEDDSPTIFTKVLQDEVAGKDTGALIEYINTHKNNFEINNITAKNILQQLILDAKMFVVKANDNKAGDSEKPISKERALCISNDELFAHIFERIPTSSQRSIFKDERLRDYLPREILNNFPEASMLSASNLSADSLRKSIILLFSFVYWSKIGFEIKGFTPDGKRIRMMQSEMPDFDDYIEDLNFKLNECGLARLYHGNPHDWLYCYCMAVEIKEGYLPLDAFREIISNVFEQVEGVN